ncbi:MAG: YdcF family protein [Myxococcales bacterium]|nr:YdcF family protein [Myxococcales bacterium]
MVAPAGIVLLLALGLALAVHLFGRTDRARAAGAIVVLGARVLPGGVPSGSLRARVEKAIELYRRGLAPLLLFSGGVGDHPPAEALVARELALAQGVPAEACLTEEESRRTMENAWCSARRLRSLGVQEVILVSDGFHLLRARQCFRRAGIRAWPSPAPLEGRGLRRLDLCYWTFREALGLLRRPWLLLG